MQVKTFLVRIFNEIVKITVLILILSLCVQPLYVCMIFYL